MNTPYCTLRSPYFHEMVMRALGDRAVLGVGVNQVYEDQVFLTDGRVLQGHTIIDGRGNLPGQYPQGYQKFLGRYVTLAQDHGLERPIIMDATVDQHDGYRFVYVLPIGANKLLVEDTYYSDTPLLDEDALRHRIDAYIKASGWKIKGVDSEETGVLPIPFMHNEREPKRFEESHTVPSGMRAGLFHPTTGYSFAAAVRFAICLTSGENPSAPAVRERLHRFILDHQENSKFYRRLNNMMFLAASDQQKRGIMQQFYGRGENLIFRFYRQELSRLDRMRMLSGIPPVPIGKGLKTFLTPAESPT